VILDRRQSAGGLWVMLPHVVPHAFGVMDERRRHTFA
jgi:hypothetical protein